MLVRAVRPHYNPAMRILIPGGLPPASIATELVAPLEASCPALVDLIRHARPRWHSLRVDETGCTPLEAIELDSLGYAAAAGAIQGAGLGALRAGVSDASERVWLAELCSVAIGQDGATLLAPEALTMNDAEAEALFEAAAPLWAGSGFSALPLQAGRWRVWLPADVSIPTISPAAVAGRPLADWWPSGDGLRAWRRLANEIQMSWHDHPVNQAREAQGQPPINGLWLYGGGHGWRPRSPEPAIVRLDCLYPHFTAGAWGDWVAALPTLSSELSALSGITSVTMTGEEGAVHMDTSRRPGLRRFLPGSRDAWKQWWKRPD